MRRLLQIVVLLCVFPSAVLATSNITVTQSGSATATTATLTSTGLGDLIIVCGNRASNTEPTVPTGYTTIKHATGANTQSGTCAYKFSPGKETSTAAMANATNVFFMVVRGYDLLSTGPIGLNPAQSNGSSTSLTYPTGTMTRTDGSSMLVTFGTATGATTTTPDVCPTGPGTMTLASSTSQSTGALCYLIGATSASTVNSVTISPTTGHCGFTFEIVGYEGTTQAKPIRQNYVGVSGQACTGSCIATIPVPGSSGSGTNNYLVVTFFWSYTSTAPTVSNIYSNADSGHSTWTWTQSASSPQLDTANTTDGAQYYIVGATAGVTTINIQFSSVFTSFTARYEEYNGIATSSAIDTTAGGLPATGPFFGAGTLTTGTSGDLILQVCAQDQNGLASGPGTANLIVFGNNAFPLTPDVSFGVSGEAFTQTSSGAITPYTMQQGNAFSNAICLALAAKTSGGAGTAPSGLQIVSQQQYNFNSQTSSILQGSVLNSGDTFIVAGNAGNITGAGSQCTSVTDTLGQSYTLEQLTSSPMFAFDSNSLSGNDMITLSSCSTNGSQNWTLVELSGAANSSHTASFDSTMGLCSTGVAGGPSTNPSSAPPSCTPHATGELMMAAITPGTGPMTAVTSPSGSVYAYPVYTGMTDASLMTEGCGFGVLYNSPTSAQSWSWTDANSTSWTASAVAFIPAPAPTGVPGQFPRVIN